LVRTLGLGVNSVSSAFTNVVAISGVVNLLRDFFFEEGWNPIESKG